MEYSASVSAAGSLAMRRTYSRGDTHSPCEEVSSRSASAMVHSGLAQAVPGRRNRPDRPLVSGAQRHNLIFAALNQRQHVLAPPCQRSLHRIFVARAIVGAGNAPPVTAEMVQRGFDVMRLDPDIGHAGGDGTTKIVNAPRLYCAAKPAIQLPLGFAPAGEAGAGAIAEQAIAARSRHRGCKIKKPPKP